MQYVPQLLRATLSCFLVFVLLFLVPFSKNAGVSFSAFQHHQRWMSKAPQHYRYVLTISCYCAQEVTEPFVVEVQNQSPVIARYLSINAPVVSSYLAQYQTIDRLFQQIDNAVSRRADVVTISYDETFGYPKEIRVDQALFGRDDEMKYTITRFEALDL